MLGMPFLKKNANYNNLNPSHRKRSMVPQMSLWILAATRFTPGKTAPAHEQRRLPALNSTQSRKERCIRSRPWCPQHCPWDHLIKQILCFRNCEWEKDDAVWSLWQALIGEGRPSLAENDMPWETVPSMSLGPTRDETLNNGTPSNHESRTWKYELGSLRTSKS